jgi:hypothetical protein
MGSSSEEDAGLRFAGKKKPIVEDPFGTLSNASFSGVDLGGADLTTPGVNWWDQVAPAPVAPSVTGATSLWPQTTVAPTVAPATVPTLGAFTGPTLPAQASDRARAALAAAPGLNKGLGDIDPLLDPRRKKNFIQQG